MSWAPASQADHSLRLDKCRRLVMPCHGSFLHCCSAGRAKQRGRVYHFELRSKKRCLALRFVHGAVRRSPEC